jgi:DNA-binding transcriptional LysR family regulator
MLRGMELRHLRYFAAVAEEGTITAAARRLHLAQPSLSQQLHQLERDLGARLLDRSQRPLRLTPAGERFLADARAVLDQLDAAARAARRAGRGETGELRVGFTFGGLYDVLAPLLRRYRDRWPGVDLLPVQLAAAEQPHALRQGRIDVLVSRVTEDVRDPQLATTPVRTERLCSILPADHPAAGSPAVGLRDLAAAPLVMFPRVIEPLVFDRYLAACAAAGFSPHLAHEVTDAQTQALLIAAGDGVGLTGDSLSLRFPGLAYVPLAPPTPLTRIVAAWHQGRRSLLVERFLDALPAEDP